MIRAQTTLTEYNTIKIELSEKLQKLFQEKNKVRESLKFLLEGVGEEKKDHFNNLQIYQIQSNKLTCKWKDEHKDLIAKYQELYQQKKLDEETFQKALVEFRKLDPDGEVGEQVLRYFFTGYSDTKKFKEIYLSILQSKILSKPNMTDHHKQWLQKRTDELIKNKDKDGLEQLDNNINFSENRGLIITTPNGPLKFAPKQASFDDMKDINGIKKTKNIWTENKATNKKGLWVNFQAIEKIRESGKKICSDEEYLAAANAFPGGNILNNCNSSTKVNDFFDLLGMDQFGFRDWDGDWDGNGRILWSSFFCHDKTRSMRCIDNGGLVSRYDYTKGFGVWFLED